MVPDAHILFFEKVRVAFYIFRINAHTPFLDSFTLCFKIYRKEIIIKL